MEHVLSHVLMSGLETPSPLGRGKPSPEALEPWLALVEELMGRGVRTPSQLRKCLGIGYKTAENWLKTVQVRWRDGLTDDRINWRRESLYSEADQVARAAWAETMTANTPTEKASLLKIVLLANQRKAALTGLEGLEIKIRKEITTHTTVDLVARVETEHGLAPGALESIGRQAAKALSGGGLVIDIPSDTPPTPCFLNAGASEKEAEIETPQIVPMDEAQTMNEIENVTNVVEGTALNE